VLWESLNPAVATVDGSGLMRALLPGAVTIRATSEDVSATVAVEVLPGPAATIAIVDSADQTGIVGRALGTALRVRVTDALGNPVPNATVGWTASAGSITTSSTTDATGHATAQWTLGTAAGSQTASASIGSSANVAFTATATPDAPQQWLQMTGVAGRSASRSPIR
jgi:adhesin/invasin